MPLLTKDQLAPGFIEILEGVSCSYNENGDLLKYTVDRHDWDITHPRDLLREQPRAFRALVRPNVFVPLFSERSYYNVAVTKRGRTLGTHLMVNGEVLGGEVLHRTGGDFEQICSRTAARLEVLTEKYLGEDPSFLSACAWIQLVVNLKDAI